MIKENDKSISNEMDKVEITIGKILRIGVLISAIIMLFGFILYLTKHSTGYINDSFPTTLTDVFIGLSSLKPAAVMMFGLFCLILTPVLRVAVSIYAFYVEKDHLYVWITTLVLVILIIALCLGHYL